MRACYCVTGPGKNGCRACGAPGWQMDVAPRLTDEEVREIVRKEMERAKRKGLL